MSIGDDTIKINEVVISRNKPLHEAAVGYKQTIDRFFSSG